MADNRTIDDPALIDRLHGSLLGGAIGDALGAGIEFHDIATIRSRFGPAGVTSLVPAYGRVGAITDDTQMTLFTFEGIIRSSLRTRDRGFASVQDVVHHAYLRWLLTQGEALPTGVDTDLVRNGWLIDVPELHHRRAPGTTCLGALRSGRMSTVTEPINDSKGCGGVMRVAPAGFVWRGDEAFTTGADLAALTHGHPSGYLTGGVLAEVVSAVLDDTPVADALGVARDRLRRWDGHEETDAALAWAVAGAAHGLPTPEDIDALNERGSAGWVAEEALAISMWCVLAAEREAGDLRRADTDLVRRALLAAVNHTGDSDSTGAIAGNLLGAAVGTVGLPGEWAGQIECADVIATLVRDAALELGPNPPTAPGTWDPPSAWWDRYPGC